MSRRILGGNHDRVTVDVRSAGTSADRDLGFPDIVPDAIRKKIANGNFIRKNIPTLPKICSKMTIKLYLPKTDADTRRYKIYIHHLYFLINTLYLNFAHEFEQKVECQNMELPKIDITLYHIDVPRIFKLGEKFPYINGGYTEFDVTAPVSRSDGSRRTSGIDPERGGDSVPFGTNSEHKIVVFRAEEMDRVIIHEMVHVFGFDIPKTGQRKLPAPYLSCNEDTININEAITDFIAVVIVTRISRYYNYKHERIWSYIQAARVTKLLGFTDVAQIWNSPSCIAEKTSLIAYFVIKSALLHTYRTRGYRKLLKIQSFDENPKQGIFEKYRLLSDTNSIADLLRFVMKFRRGENATSSRDVGFGKLKSIIGKLREKKESRKEYNFANLIGAAVLDPEWQKEVNDRILHPKLFSKSGTASAKMSITESILPSDVDSADFYTKTIYTI